MPPPNFLGLDGKRASTYVQGACSGTAIPAEGARQRQGWRVRGRRQAGSERLAGGGSGTGPARV
jgi:hypothetical protein